MGAIVLDASKVNSYVLPNLNKSKTTMQEAYSTGQSLRSSLPSSFSQRSTVNEIVNQIYNIKKEISDISTMISKKIDKAKTIENKASSKVSGIASAIGGVAGGITGAAIGSTVGAVGGAVVGGSAAGIMGASVGTAIAGATGAVAGAIVGNKVGKTIVETGAKIVGGFVSGAKKVFVDVGNFFKNTGAKIANGVKSMWQKFTGTIKNLGSKVVNATKKVGKAIYNTGAKIVDGATKVANGIWDGIKKIGKSIWDSGTKIVNSATSWVKDKALPWLKKAASAVWDGLKWFGKQILKTAASIWNVVVSVVKGLVSFVEAVVDAAILIVGGLVGSISGMVVDLFQGLIFGEWDWSATSAVWKKGILPAIAVDASGFLLDWAYSDYAYSPFQKGGIVCDIAEGVGYYTGVIVATAFTGGAVGATTAGANFATTFAVSGVAELGRATQDNYNKVIDNNTKEYYVKQIMDNNPELTQKEAEEYFEIAKQNGLFSDYDIVRKQHQDNISAGEITKLVIASGSQAVVEGTTTAILRTKMPSGGKAWTKAIDGVQNFGKGFGKAGVQFAKAYAKEGTTVLVDDEYDLKKATIDGTSAAITEIINGRVKLRDIPGKIKNSTIVQKLTNTNVVQSAKTAITTTKNKIVNSSLGTSVKNVPGTIKTKFSNIGSRLKDSFFTKNANVPQGSTEGFVGGENIDIDLEHKMFIEKVRIKLGESWNLGKQEVKKYMLDKSVVKDPKTGAKAQTTSLKGFYNVVVDKTGKDVYKNLTKEGVLNPATDFVVSTISGE